MEDEVEIPNQPTLVRRKSNEDCCKQLPDQYKMENDNWNGGDLNDSNGLNEHSTLTRDKNANSKTTSSLYDDKDEIKSALIGPDLQKTTSSDSSNELDKNNVTMRKLSLDSHRKTYRRTTERIVSDAFSFLKFVGSDTESNEILHQEPSCGFQKTTPVNDASKDSTTVEDLRAGDTVKEKVHSETALNGSCRREGGSDYAEEMTEEGVYIDQGLVVLRTGKEEVNQNGKVNRRTTLRVLSNAFDFLKQEDDSYFGKQENELFCQIPNSASQSTCSTNQPYANPSETCVLNKNSQIDDTRKHDSPSAESPGTVDTLRYNGTESDKRFNDDKDNINYSLNDSSVDKSRDEHILVSPEENQMMNKECIDICTTDNGETNITEEYIQNNISALKEKHIGVNDETSTPTRRVNLRNSPDDDSDGSSDDDTKGVYNASTRNSCWLRVDESGSLSLPAPEQNQHYFNPPSNSSTSSIFSEDNSSGGDSTTDAVFTDGSVPPKLLTHKRSDSTTTTLSEKEFKQENKYNSLRKCIVKRHDSQQEYQRFSTRCYDLEKSVFIQKNSDDGDIGLHILDSHPAVITSVDEGSPAEKAGIQAGQIIISVNKTSVLEMSHADIIKLVQQCPSSLHLEVGFSDINIVRDLQLPLLQGTMFKQSTSGLIKTWKKRYFVLRQDNCLYYYKSKTEFDPLGAIPMTNYSVSRFIDTNKQYCFKAEKYGARTYYFMTESREEMTKWVGALNAAADRTKNRTDSWMDVTSHNVGLPALEIRKPECSGYLSKLGRGTRTWRKRYCVLKDACIYYYKAVGSYSAQGVAHLHGYTVNNSGVHGKKLTFVLFPPEKQMRTFYFSADNPTDKERWMDAMTKSIQRWVCVGQDNVAAMPTVPP